MPRFSSLLFAQLVWSFRSSATMLVERVTMPAPIILEPSQSFDGNDGPFSSFNISVGTPPQNVKVHVSTSVWQTLVVIKEGCGPGSPSNCATLRGGEFLSENSTTWQNNTANPAINIYPMLVDTQLGYSGRAELGFDVVSLTGPAGATLKNQTVGGFAADDTYLGLFGIDPRSSNFTNTPPIPSYLQNLRNQSLIPSLAWGFTAGNQYHKMFGSLTLGGYDRSRFVQHDGSWPMDVTNDLAVQLQSITWDQGQGLLPTPITVSIDSSLPYLWLPIEACTLFEIAFGLTWNDTSKLYLVNETLHTNLVQQNANLTFNLGGMVGGSSINVNIILPYASLDLTASDPIIRPTSKYYPLKRAANSTQYVLGRTFLQEAYVVADYERRNFSVFPCQWGGDSKPEIISIFSPTYDVAGAASSSSTSTANRSGGSSHAGPIIGGLVGGIGLLVIISALVYFFYWRPKQRQDYSTHGAIGEKVEMHAPLPANPALALDDPHLNRAELAGSTQGPSGMPSEMSELEGSGQIKRSAVSEMPVREEAASEMCATNNSVHEMATPRTMSEAPQDEFPWRRSATEGGAQSPLGSPGIQSVVSPVSSPSPGPPSPEPWNKHNIASTTGAGDVTGERY